MNQLSCRSSTATRSPAGKAASAASSRPASAFICGGQLDQRGAALGAELTRALEEEMHGLLGFAKAPHVA